MGDSMGGRTVQHRPLGRDQTDGMNAAVQALFLGVSPLLFFGAGRRQPPDSALIEEGLTPKSQGADAAPLRKS